jgi:hypothetical protein
MRRELQQIAAASSLRWPSVYLSKPQHRPLWLPERPVRSFGPIVQPENHLAPIQIT